MPTARSVCAVDEVLVVALTEQGGVPLIEGPSPAWRQLWQSPTGVSLAEAPDAAHRLPPGLPTNTQAAGHAPY